MTRLLLILIAVIAAVGGGPARAVAHSGEAKPPAADPGLVDAFGSAGAAALPADSPARMPSAAELRVDAALRSTRASETLECDDTVGVPGQGPSCRISGGLWRINLDGGGSVVTHGMDAPPPARGSEPPGGLTPSSFGSPDVSDVTCVPRGSATPHFQAVYSYPTGTPNRAATVVPQLRTEIYRASAMVDQRAQTQSGGAERRRLVVACTAGELDVQTIALPTAAASDNFSTIASDISAAGEFPSGLPVNVLAFHDDPVAGGAAGTGHYYDSDVPSTSHGSRAGGSLAVQFEYSAGVTPDYSVLLHEAGHNMGAVADTAPQASGGGHCNDGFDVMCYDDGGATAAYVTTACLTETWDCNGDTYFNVAPAAGSWLATKWNLGHSLNWFLDAVSGAPDISAPTTPTSLHVTSKSTTRISLAWDASSDDRAVTAYRVSRSTAGGPMTPLTMVAANRTYLIDNGTAAGVAYRYEVSATDGTNDSAVASLSTHGYDATPPTAPGSSSATVVSSTRVDLSWTAAADNFAVSHYTVWRLTRGTWSSIGTTAGTSFSATGLSPATAYQFDIEATDDDGNTGDAASVSAATVNDSSDVTPPSAPRALAVDWRTSSEIRIDWEASTDDRGVLDYRVLRSAGSGAAQQIAVRGAGQRFWTDSTATGGVAYTYSVVARDGINSSPAATVRAHLRDDIAPSAPTGLRATSASASSITLAWAPSTDNFEVTDYRVWIEDSTWRVATTTAANTATIDALAAGTSYRVMVEAVDDDGNSAETIISAETSAHGNADPDVWQQIGRISLRPAGSRVRMTWSPPAAAAPSVRRYEVYLRSGRIWKRVGRTQRPSFLIRRQGSARSFSVGVVAVHVDGRRSERVSALVRLR